MSGLQSGEGRMTIDSVVWAQHINVTDRRTHRQPRRDSNIRPNSLRSGEKNYAVKEQFALHSLTVSATSRAI